VIVPQGKHTIEMKFEPASFSTGRQISFASNILILIGIAFQGVVMHKKSKK
jgi:uncharacterized membrane protein YfhO